MRNTISPLVLPTTIRAERCAYYKRFTSAAEAIRFAVEELPTDLLRGAYLEVAEERSDAVRERQQSAFAYVTAAYAFLNPTAAAGATISHATSLM
jgi:Arc/MetJ-type ribon-helix-helix transcriptional regulator